MPMETLAVNCRGFSRELIAVGCKQIRQLTAEGYLGNLHVFFSPIKCVNNNFQTKAIERK